MAKCQTVKNKRWTQDNKTEHVFKRQRAGTLPRDRREAEVRNRQSWQWEISLGRSAGKSCITHNLAQNSGWVKLGEEYTFYFVSNTQIIPDFLHVNHLYRIAICWTHQPNRKLHACWTPPALQIFVALSNNVVSISRGYGQQITLLLLQSTHRTIGCQRGILSVLNITWNKKRHWALFDESRHSESWIKDTVENFAKIFQWREGGYSGFLFSANVPFMLPKIH